AFADGFEVSNGPQRASDEPLDFLRAPRLLAACGFARSAPVRGPWQHSVLARYPPLVLALQKMRNAVLDRRGSDHARAPRLNQHAAFRRRYKIRRQLDRAQLTRRSSVRSQFTSLLNRPEMQHHCECSRRAVSMS